MSVSAIAGELVTEDQDSADDEFKPGHIKTVGAKYYKTHGSSVEKAIFTEDDRLWHPTTDNE